MFPCVQPVGAGGGRVLAEVILEQVEVELQVLNTSFAELHIGATQTLGHFRLVLAGQSQHVVVAIDADHPPLGTDDLRGDVADFSTARSQIEHRLPGLQIP